MEPTVPTSAEAKKDQVSPQREAVEVKLKEVEIRIKEQELESIKLLDDLEIERRTLENEEFRKKGGGWQSPLDQLLAVSRALCIDNERTVVGSEPAIKSIWDEHELAEIKDLIMKKVRKL